MTEVIWGSGKEVWEVWGAFGDTFGGIANAVTMVFAVGGFLWARREYRRAQQLHAHETRVATAKEVWRAAFGVTRNCGILVEVLREKQPFDTFRERFAEIERSFERFSDATADTGLIFAHDVFVVVDQLNEATGVFVASLDGVTKETYSSFESSAVREAMKRVYLAQGHIFVSLGRVVHTSDFEAWEATMVPHLAAAEAKLEKLGFVGAKLS